MFKVQRMSKLLIAASKDQLDPIVRELYRYNIFHIEDFVEQDAEGYEGFRIGKPMPNASKTSGDLLRIRSIENILGANADNADRGALQKADALHKSIGDSLPEIEKEVNSLVAKRNDLESKVRDCDQKLADLEAFRAFPFDLSLLSGYEGFAAIAGHIPADVELPFD